MLVLDRVGKLFGGLVAVDEVSLKVSKGEILGIIGPNGAGKTTLFNLIAGYFSVSRGRISFGDKEISSLKAHQVARLGIYRTFQKASVFQRLSVIENIVIGRHNKIKASLAENLACLPRSRSQEIDAWKEARRILHQIGLEKLANRQAGTLSYGNQKLLSIGIALAGDPHLLLLDEPAAGMNIDEGRALVCLIRSLKGQGLTTVVVDHDMRVMMDLCERIVVLHFGRLLASGKPAEISSNQKVIEVYLGSRKDYA
jgi:branched-chain amino acid transport system ATP-binding protein